jgi:peptidoglycan/xylan/chitin deacetylase (PgdA/CDA1 family)
VTVGAKLLEARGLRGTFYVSAGLAGLPSRMGRYATREELTAAAAAGHELACHTFSHLDCGAIEPAVLAADLDRSAAALQGWGAGPASTFAYPYGDVSPIAKRAAAARFALSRAIHPGLIETGTDLNQAPAVGIEGPAGAIYGRRWLEWAVARRAWLIFYTHDVRDEPTDMGCTPGALRELIDRARALGCDIVTVAEGARRVGP